MEETSYTRSFPMMRKGHFPLREGSVREEEGEGPKVLRDFRLETRGCITIVVLYARTRASIWL